MFKFKTSETSAHGKKKKKKNPENLLEGKSRFQTRRFPAPRLSRPPPKVQRAPPRGGLAHKFSANATGAESRRRKMIPSDASPPAPPFSHRSCRPHQAGGFWTPSNRRRRGGASGRRGLSSLAARSSTRRSLSPRVAI